MHSFSPSAIAGVSSTRRRRSAGRVCSSLGNTEDETAAASKKAFDDILEKGNTEVTYDVSVGKKQTRMGVEEPTYNGATNHERYAE